MWKTGFLNLEEVFAFLVEKVEYNPTTGFSFCSVLCGNSFTEAFKILGESEIYNTESDQQQTAQYNAFIDHSEHGKRDHHQLNLLLWAFNREPISILKVHVDYYKTGLNTEPFNASLNVFLNSIIEKIGPPDVKKMTRGKQELSYKIGNSKLWIWNNSEGVRIQIK